MMLVSDFEEVLEKLAPRALAEPGDNCGLLVGDRKTRVARVLVALELTEPVLAEAISDGFDTVLTHHPLLFSPLSSLVESRPKERLVRELIRQGVNLIAQHTNLDSAENGLAAIAADALGLQDSVPLRRSPAGWYKLVGFVPPDAVENVAAAVFSIGAGRIGEYDGCAFASQGRGWFTPGPEAHPAVGQLTIPERAPEIRWETVVPRSRLAAAITAYITAHPYEEPAFDVYAVDDVLTRAGLGRQGTLPEEMTVEGLAARTAQVFGLEVVRWSGEGGRRVEKVAVLPGSGSSLLPDAAGLDVMITGDLGYHEADRADEFGLAVIDTPHGELEWWCLRRWVETLRSELAGTEVQVATSETWRSPWTAAGAHVAAATSGPAAKAGPAAEAARSAAPGASATASAAPAISAPPKSAPAGARRRMMRLRVDGGSRGNPGPGAIGVVLEDAEGRVLDTVSQAIGICTNNVAEYQALLTGLELAEAEGAEELEILSDSELLVKQVRGDYRVRNEGLKPLYEEALRMLKDFRLVSIRHVRREDNVEADRLVNKALDEAASTSL
jgi:dinuclear metal center YbgI/SA1388 family protein